MTKNERHEDAQFTRLDRVIRSQRRLMKLNGLVTTLFVVGALVSVSSLTGCAVDDDDGATTSAGDPSFSSESGTPLPAADDGLTAMRARILDAVPGARFELIDVVADGGQITAVIDVRGAARPERLADLRAQLDATAMRAALPAE